MFTVHCSLLKDNKKLRITSGDSDKHLGEKKAKKSSYKQRSPVNSSTQK